MSARLRTRWDHAGGTTRRLFVAGAVITAGFAVVALLAPLLAPYGQSAHDAPQLAGPGLSHPFGTTNLRFDVLSRVIFGARLAFEVVLESTAFAVVVGVPLGLVSGYTGRRFDRLARLFDCGERRGIDRDGNIPPCHGNDVVDGKGMTIECDGLRHGDQS